MLSNHALSEAGSPMRWESLPSVPTTRLTRASSAARCSLAAMISLSVSAILPGTPVMSRGIRAPKSPLRTASRTSTIAA